MTTSGMRGVVGRSLRHPSFVRAAAGPPRQAAAGATPSNAHLGGRSAALLRLARGWARRELRWSLDGLRVAGLAQARAATGERPVIFASTHVAFWDLFVVLALDEALGTEGYAILDAANVGRISPYRWLGGVPLDPKRPLAGLRSAAARLQRPGRAVWVFPQGDHRPPHLRPLGFRRGVALLARLAPAAAVVPVALQYAFRARSSPAAWACFGEPLATRVVAGRAGVERLEREVERALDRIDLDLAGERAGFRPLVEPRRSRSLRRLG